MLILLGGKENQPRNAWLNLTQDTKPVPLDPLGHLHQVGHANQADPRNKQPINVHIQNYNYILGRLNTFKSIQLKCACFCL